MTSIAIIILVAAVLSLTGVAWASFPYGTCARWQARWKPVWGPCVTTPKRSPRACGNGWTSLTAQVRELERQPAVTLTPGLPKPGMNVVKRSQALRMHRRGDRPEQIAAALDLPRQEVDLLLKVHSIVISSI